MKRFLPFLSLIILSAFSGCSRPSTPETIVLQTDWFAQPEQGGFYQALVKGFYDEVGLTVEIRQGGPNAMTTQKILKGTAHFAMHRADAVYLMVQRDVPVIFVMPTLQEDPQALLLHESNPIDSLQELDGRSVMAVPGLSWIRWVENRYNIRLNIIPHDFGMERFLNNPDWIQQCLITNEPYYAQLHNVPTKTIRLAESGFNPYHGIYCLKTFAKNHPDIVRRFIQASLKGWKDFVENDPSPAFELIAQLNPKMTPEFLNFSYQALIRNQMITGQDNQSLGRLNPSRLDLIESAMIEYQIVSDPVSTEWYSREFLPNP